MKSQLLYSLFMGGLLCPLSSFGVEEYPRNGLVQNDSESSAINFSCRLIEQELHCEMTQTFVRRNLTEAEAPEEREKLLRDLRSEEVDTKAFKKTCKDMHEYEQKIMIFIDEGQRKKLPKKERDALAKAPKAELDDILKQLRAVADHCKNPSPATREYLSNVLIEEKLGTCRVGSHSWTEKFTRAKGIEAMNAGDSSAWVSSSEPSGPCGTVLLNRFEPEKFLEDSKLKFWQYIARKAVTNPH